MLRTHALPLLEVKQHLEKDWNIEKEHYDFAWKKFLLAIKFVCVETRIQFNGRPLDFVYLDRNKAINECFDEVQRNFILVCHRKSHL